MVALIAEDHAEGLFKLAAADEHFVGDQAERVEIGAAVGFFAAQQFGRHAAHRADGHELLLAHGGGEAEVCDLEAAGVWQKNVSGLEIAVDDVVLMDGLKRLGGGGDDADRLLDIHGAGVLDELLFERSTVDVFTDQQEATRVVDDIDELNEAVTPGGRGALLDVGLGLDAASSFVVIALIGRANLFDRQVAVQQVIVSAIDDGSAARADLLDDAQMSELFTGLKRGGGATGGAGVRGIGLRCVSAHGWVRRAEVGSW